MIHPDEHGFYGEFGGAYIPEMLHANVEQLRREYRTIIADPAFQRDFQRLLRDYVGRPSPLYLAERLSDHYGFAIYLKREDLNHTGAHKINNTIGQILLAQRLGKTRIIAETGAGQHGVATATVCALMGIECVVYMGSVDIERQAPNVARMKMLGAEVRPAESGSRTLKDATNEAIRDWIGRPVDTHYIIGSVVGPHPYPDLVTRFQSVISEELKLQLLEQTGRSDPDAIVACVGGGSNAAGAFFHYLDRPGVRLIAVEAAGHGIDSGESAATSVLGSKGIIHGSRTLLMQTSDGQIVEPYSISAGLDYPGIGPLHAHLIATGRAEAVSITDDEALQAGFFLARNEGIIPALESAHAFAALEKCRFSSSDLVVVNLSGRGDKDLETYIRHDPSMQEQVPMQRIEELFRRKQQRVLSIYYTAGYPGLSDTAPIALALEKAGADLIEIGMPYSDPLADGPTIQQSGQQALANGMTLALLFDQISGLRAQTRLPLVLMGYFNQVMQFGEADFFRTCREVGVDGLILPDLPVDEYERHYRKLVEENDLGISFLITPQTAPERIRRIDALTRGFLYVVADYSITGTSAGISGNQIEYFRRIRDMDLKNPQLIGFGIADHSSFDQACEYAAGAIVGSAFIRALAADGVLPSQIDRFIKNLRSEG